MTATGGMTDSWERRQKADAVLIRFSLLDAAAQGFRVEAENVAESKLGQMSNGAEEECEVSKLQTDHRNDRDASHKRRPHAASQSVGLLENQCRKGREVTSTSLCTRHSSVS